jgi:hypothetical protein
MSTAPTSTATPPPARPSRFRPATRKQAKLRMAIDGPSGSGKTVTALRFAHSLGQRIAVIDTEHGSASLYAGEVFDDGTPFNFAVDELHSFSPTEYTAAIEEAGRQGFDVIIVDSLSHAWEGKDGALELVDRNSSKNKYTAWKDITPMHRRMVESILASPAHVICTMRSKTEYVLEDNEKGQKTPRKIGLAPIQRAGMEYEFTIYCSMDLSHIMSVTKSRCRAVDGLTVVKPGAGFIGPLIQWLESGAPSVIPAPAMRATDDQVERIVRMIGELKLPIGPQKRELLRRYSVNEFAELNADQARELEVRYGQAMKLKRERNGTPEAIQSQPDATQTPPPTTNGTPPQPQSAQPRLTSAHEHRLKELRAELEKFGLTAEVWKTILTKRNVTTARDFSAAQAEELIAKMESNLRTVAPQNPVLRPLPNLMPTTEGKEGRVDFPPAKSFDGQGRPVDSEQ